MIRSRIHAHPAVLILAVALTGCSLPVSTPGPGGSIETPAAGLPGGECLNPLLPVVDRATWEYASTGSDFGDYTFTHQAGSIRPDGFSLGIEYSTGVSATQEWSCHGGDLAVLDAGGGAAGGLASINGVSSQMASYDNTGMTLPARIRAGDGWQQTLTVEGTTRFPDGREGAARGTFSADYQAVGTETLTVPAGTFEAMRIDVVWVYDLVVTLEGLEVPVTTGASQTLWYAPDVGLVQIYSSSEMMLDEEIVLLRYSIP